MTFNPCGRAVAYLEDSVTDYIKPFRDSDILVKRRWYPVPELTPLLGFPTVFNSIHYVFQKWMKEGPGEVWGEPITYPRVGTPPGLTYDHICGSEDDFIRGAVFDPDADVEYDDEWIPLCCGRASVCTTQLCTTDPVHGLSAAQLWSYPIPHQDSDENTPAYVFQRAFNQGDTVPYSPGLLSAWYPAGVAGVAGWSDEMVANNARVPQFREVTFRRGVGEAISQRWDTDGYAISLEKGGSSGTMTLEFNGTVLELCGDNLTICPAILPATVFIRGQSTITAAGTTQADATPITTTTTTLIPGGAGAGVRLPDWDGGVVYLKWQGPFTDSTKLYPNTGYGINGASLNVPITLDVPPNDRAVWMCVRSDPTNSVIPRPQWSVVLVDEESTLGTVTSVDIGTSSAGLSVGGGPITGAGTLTVDLDSALEDLLAVSMTTDLFTGDGSGGWSPVTIGDYLAFAAGVLDVVPPTATTGQTIGTAFSITGTSGTYQATGITITLPAAGTYLVSACIRGSLTPLVGAACLIVAKLFNTTDAADVANSETLVTSESVAGQNRQATAVCSRVVTVAASKAIEIYAFRTGTTWTTSDIASNTNGRTTLSYVRLS